MTRCLPRVRAVTPRWAWTSCSPKRPSIFRISRSERDDPLLKQNLEALREAAGLDAVVIATFDDAHKSIEHVVAASGLFATFNPIVFHGEPLERLPYLRSKLGHLRIVEIRDTTRPRRELVPEGARFASLHIGAALIVGVAIQGRVQAFIALCSTLPRDSWDANLHLMLKLLGSSYSSGIERLRYQKHFHQIEERNELALHGANDGLWDFEVDAPEDLVLAALESRCSATATTKLEPLVDWQQLLHPDDTVRVSTALRDHLSGKEPLFESVHRLRHRDGVWLWVESRAKARLDEHGRARRIVGVDLDVTERKLYEEALFKEKESAQITLQSIGDGVITTDAQCRPSTTSTRSRNSSPAGGSSTRRVSVIEEIYRSFHEETCEPLENPLAVSIRRTRATKSVRPMLLIRRDGNELYIESSASPIRDGAGNVSGGVLVFHDVSESRELNRRLSYHASHDMLTGLVNRREFEPRLERALKSAKAREASYALCYLDIDQFKIINDTCGHSGRRCAAGAGGCAAEVQDPLARHAVAPRWRRVRHPARELRARRCDAHGRDAARGDPQLPASCGKSACSAWAPASAWCRSPPTTKTSRRSSPPPTAPAPRRRRTAATACTASPRTTSS